MKILTFDTSLNKMYITLSEDGDVFESAIVESTKEYYHSAFLIPTIIKFLQKYNLTMQNIEAIGVNIGPGSFTGIRASCVVARVMGQSLNIPVVGVSSLEILSLMNESLDNTLILIDARKGKAYTALYGQNEIISPCAMEYEQALELAKNNNTYVIADYRMAEKLSEQEIEHVIFEDSSFDYGKNLAKLTFKYLKTKNADEFYWAKLKPLYIQPPPISMPKSSINK